MNITAVTFYETVFEALSLVSDLNNPTINRNLHYQSEKFYIGSKDNQIYTIRKEDIELLNKTLQRKLVSNHSAKDKPVNFGQLDAFLRFVNKSITGLNHCGIGYICKDIDEEIQGYKDAVASTPNKLYEEVSNVPGVRWFFIGDKTKEDSCLFELVVKQGTQTDSNLWYPHFQIDFDTKLTAVEIENLCKKYFGKDFINFTLDIKDYGVVLHMGCLGAAGGASLWIGFGTLLRDNNEHRRSGLIEV